MVSRLILAVAAFCTPFSAAADELARAEACAPAASHALCHQIIVPAAVAELWPLWTTSEGLQSWVAPVAVLE